MKKIISLTLALSMLISAGTFTAFAEDKAVPVDVDEAVYAQLMENEWICDKNNDGIITDEELKQVTQLDIDLDGIKDLSWVSKLEKCHYITFENGEITDFSALKQMPVLSTLKLENVPLTDISFIKELDLDECRFEKMDQITTAQKMAVLKWSAPDIWAGTSARINCSPRGLTDFTITLKNTDIAVFMSGKNTGENEYEYIYGRSAGTTEYTVSLDGEVYYTGELKIKETPGAYAPQLRDTEIKDFKVDNSKYYNPDTETGNSGKVVLLNGTLYSIKGSKITAVETDVAKYEYVYKRSYSKSYNYADMVLKNDGTLLLNGEKITDISVRDMRDGYYIGENGSIYTIVPQGDGFTTATVATDSKDWVKDCAPLYIDKNDLIKYYSCDLIGDGKVRVFTGNTNIGTPVSSYGEYSLCYVVDSAHHLYELDFSGSFIKTKLADDAVSVRAGELYGSVEYVTTSGKVKNVKMSRASSGYSRTDGKNIGVHGGTFYIPEYQRREISENDAVFSYYIDSSDTMSLSFLGDYCGLTNVADEVASAYDNEQDNGYVYFLRTDGSIWGYNLDKKQWQEAVAGTAPKEEVNKVKGDVNADGAFNVSDAVLFQKWLSGDKNTKLADWKAADFCADDKLDVYDFCLMKKELVL